MEYDSTNVLIEHNDIHGSVGPGIRLKDDPENVTIRLNNVYNNAMAGFEGPTQDDGDDVFIYQNIFRNNNTSGRDDQAGVAVNVNMRNIQVYNNTFVDNRFADFMVRNNADVSDIQLWNNISYRPVSIHWSIQYGASASTITYSNYNCFYPDAGYEYQNTVLGSLAQWQNAGSSFDMNSIAADPLFQDAAANNYKLQPGSPCLTAGRGGAYAQVMGAYITGDETIGYSPSGEQPGGDTDPPAVPTGLGVQVVP
jgi:hypothetical protein